jgi:hypothetical protein
MIGVVVVLGISGGQLFLIVWVVAAVCILGSFWRGRDRRPKRELGPVVFSAEVGVRFRRGPNDSYSFVTRHFGWPRLLVHEDTVEINCPDTRWMGWANLINDTYDAADCEMDVARIYRYHPVVPVKDEYVVLRTTDQRGFLEVGFRPRTATLDDLQQELIRAGVRPVNELAPSLHHAPSP